MYLLPCPHLLCLLTFLSSQKFLVLGPIPSFLDICACGGVFSCPVGGRGDLAFRCVSSGGSKARSRALRERALLLLLLLSFRLSPLVRGWAGEVMEEEEEESDACCVFSLASVSRRRASSSSSSDFCVLTDCCLFFFFSEILGCKLSFFDALGIRGGCMTGRGSSNVLWAARDSILLSNGLR